MNTLKGLIADVVSAITTADASMSTYTATLITAFASLDNSLSSSYNSITNVASEFIKQISSSVTKLSTTVDNFNTQINAFNDDIIKPNATAIVSLTSEFTFFYNYFMGVLQPNSEEKINSVAHMVTDSVQTAAKDVLYNAYQTLNNAMGNLPAKASTCVSTYLSPMVTSLSLSIPTMASCLNLLDAPSVANEQVALLNKLLDDRLTYVTSWTNAISGVTSSSAASVRKTATLKLLAVRSTSPTLQNTIICITIFPGDLIGQHRRPPAGPGGVLQHIRPAGIQFQQPPEPCRHVSNSEGCRPVGDGDFGFQRILWLHQRLLISAIDKLRPEFLIRGVINRSPYGFLLAC